jgi:hypothetical protein
MDSDPKSSQEDMTAWLIGFSQDLTGPLLILLIMVALTLCGKQILTGDQRKDINQPGRNLCINKSK